MFEKIQRWIRFNLFYLGRPPWDTGISPPELVDFISSVDPGRALDIGCGTGTNLLTMAKLGWEVMGVDIAWLSVVRARIKLRNSGLNGRVIHGDITGNLHFNKPFDFILDIGCYHSLIPKERYIYHNNLQRWLSNGGIYMIYAHRRTSPNHKHGISSQDVEEFQRYLDLQWREDSQETRPGGGGGRSSTWISFEKRS